MTTDHHGHPVDCQLELINVAEVQTNMVTMNIKYLVSNEFALGQ